VQFFFSSFVVHVIEFVVLLNVLIVAVDYYALFACVTHRRHVVANIVGILYSSQLYVFYSELDDKIQLNRRKLDCA